MDRLIRGPAQPAILGPFAWADLPDAVSGPVLLESGVVVQRDSRTEGSQWVPLDLADPSRWTLLTSLHGSTYVAGTPPTGWAEVVATSGTVTVASDQIVLTAIDSAGSDSSLIYTIAAHAGKDIRVVVRAVLDSAGTTASNYLDTVEYHDSARTGAERLFFTPNRPGTNVLQIQGGSTYAVGAAETVARTYDIRYSDLETDITTSGVTIIDSSDRLVAVAAPNSDWSGSSALSKLEISVTANGIGVPSTWTIDHIAIYVEV